MMLRVLFLCTLVARVCAQADLVKFTPLDISHISFYGPQAVYRPQLCPESVSFAARARLFPEMADDKLAILTSDVLMDDEPCTSSTSMLLFSPIGRPDHLPPQWVFEDSAVTGMAVNFTCGAKTYSIRYGYLNDVQTPSGFLDDSVVYLDFAVIPNTHPFAFCSYVTRRDDGDRPVNHEPFPTVSTWNQVRESRNLPPLPEDSGAVDDDKLKFGTLEPTESEGAESEPAESEPAESEPTESPESTTATDDVAAAPVVVLPSPEATVPSSMRMRVMEAVAGIIGPRMSSMLL